MDEQQWLGIGQLAAELGVPQSTVYAWRHKGSGPRGYRLGRAVRFRRADIEVWLAERADPISTATAV